MTITIPKGLHNNGLQIAMVPGKYNFYVHDSNNFPIYVNVPDHAPFEVTSRDLTDSGNKLTLFAVKKRELKFLFSETILPCTKVQTKFTRGHFMV